MIITKSFIVYMMSVCCFISGCMYINSNVNDYNNLQADNEYTYEDSEKGFVLGKKLKELEELKDINYPVILVNKSPIIKKEVEAKKIVAEVIGTATIKDEITELIRNKVVEVEAIRFNIEPSAKEIDEYIEFTKEILRNGSSETLKEYIKGYSITEEEYLEMLRKDEYKIRQRIALWEFVRKDKEEQIKTEAIKRHVTFDSVDKEYYDKYVDDLVKNADIEYLDLSVKQLVEG